MEPVAGKTALVTGAVSGIGLGIAKVFAAAGMKVMGTYRREAHLAEARAYFDQHPELAVQFVPLDVRDRAQLRRAADETEHVFGKIHVLVNNAGVNLLGAMDHATDEDWAWIMGVNFYGVLHAVQEVLPRIRAHGEGGHIVNVGSMASFLPGARSGMYATSKFAVRGYTESLRELLAGSGIGVSLVSPGLVSSNIHEAALHRPAATTGFPVDEAAVQRFAVVNSQGMDPVEVGEKTLRGMLRNDLHIFTHPDHREELAELFDEVLAAFPDEPMDPRRATIEQARRNAREKRRG